MTALLIGISTPNPRIEQALRQQGATPVLLSPSSNIPLHQLHGIVITGNKHDVPPHLYGEQAHPETLIEADNTQIAFETALIRYSYLHSLPALTICRGTQLLNVIFGGTLTQHLPDHSDGSVNHRQQAGTYHESAHRVEISAKSLLLARKRENIQAEVNSDHHQAIARIAEGFALSATAPDGTVEAIEHKAHPFLLGVQWHPEYLVSTIDREIFENFVQAAAPSSFRLAA